MSDVTLLRELKTNRTFELEVCMSTRGSFTLMEKDCTSLDLPSLYAFQIESKKETVLTEIVWRRSTTITS